MTVQHKITLACALLLSLAACQQSKDSNKAALPRGPTELDWAKSALERNPNVEVVATDTQAGVFTLRMRGTGEVRAVQLSELAATPVSQLNAPAPTVAQPTQPESAPAQPAPTPSAASSEPAMMAAKPQEPDRSIPHDLSKPMSEQPGFTVDRSQGQLKISGPGVSIVSSGKGGDAGRGTPVAQQTIDPIICEGQRMLHFDNRSIYVEGDAITVRGGCEIYITNSRIISSGTGLIIREGATAHIVNSHIEGSAASFQADGGSKVYVRSSTFQGLSRRDMLATVQDEGGNQWR